MKKFYFVLVLLFAATVSFAQEKFEPKEIFGNEAEKIWPGAEHIWLKQENTVPSFVQFRNGCEPDEVSFFITLRKTFLLPSSYSFEQTGTETDPQGWQHKRFQLRVNNVPVANGIFLLHILNGKVKKFNGYLFNNVDINTSASLSESSALAFALKDVNATTYKWELPEEEQFLKEESADGSATFYPKGETEILQVGDNTSNTFKTVWKFDIYAHEPMSRQYIYIDAQSGEVLRRTTRIHHANTPGTATTVYRGNRPIVADSYNGAYRLYETTRGLGVRTRNMQRGTSYANSVEFTDANNIWSNVNANLDQYAGDAHWGAEMTYDFFQTMGRNSINGNGYLLNIYMHYNVGYVNAFWDGTRMTFGDGDGTYDPLVPLDITGHEIAHGLDQYTADLDYSYESGALNESFSDIFGAAVEWYADSTQADWTMAEDIGPIFRSMSSPNTYGDPDTYDGTNWYTGTDDYGGVHTNSGVQNHWYYRLVQGGSGTNDIGSVFNITGIGRTKATAIAWRNMVNYLTNNSDYADARFYAIQSAIDLYGACSQEVISTTKAWYAVGVGPDYSAGADAQFSASPLIGCTLPFTVNFSNTSSNANSYIWYFGDGTTSSATSPSHIYTASGLYSVKLVAIGGGTCGSDSVVYSNLINVSTSNACQVILPATGTYQLQTACNGSVYDNGGPAANYTSNTSSVVTIAPTGAARVRLHFTQFDMEDAFDYLYVYDGPSTASAVIGSYTGATIPADIISSASAITI
ncbi:MAG: M4 family metallopeptidase, partial [Bacteroidota bacterium]